jgi:uncharacterized protein YraI
MDLPTPFPGMMAAVTSDLVEVRSGPGMDYPSYGKSGLGDAAMVVGSTPDNSWMLILISMDDSPAGIGWVPTGQVYLENPMEMTIIQPPPPAVRLEIPPPAASNPQVTIAFDTGVLLGPGASYPAYGIAPGGVSAEASGRSPDLQWFQIKVSERHLPYGLGWVSASAVQATNVDSLPVILPPALEQPFTVAPPMPDTTSLITTENLWVRSGPGEEYPTFGYLWSATRADFLGMSPDFEWYAIRLYVQDTPEGIGWVRAASTTALVIKDVPVIEPPPLEGLVSLEEPLSGEIIGTTLDVAQVRLGPSREYDSLGVTATGEQAAVIGKNIDGAWLAVKIPVALSSNGTGWVKAGCVQVVGAAELPLLPAP